MGLFLMTPVFCSEHQPNAEPTVLLSVEQRRLHLCFLEGKLETACFLLSSIKKESSVPASSPGERNTAVFVSAFVL